jgi:hypothetical protein
VDEAVAEFVAHYRSIGLTGTPFNPDQVAALARHLGLPLPPAYRAYLLVAGAYPPPALVGSDCHGEYLFRLRGWADDLLAECGYPFALPADAVVFLMHQGYQFCYFRADGCTDDPPVFDFIEGMAAPYAPARLFERFSWWVEACV